MNPALPLYFRMLFLSVSCFIYTTAEAQFSGSYDPGNWSTIQVSGANGSVNANSAPTSIALTGPDNVSGQAWTRYQITLPATGTLSFSWSVAHQDPGYDGFGYWYNNTYTELTDITQSGTTSISVSQGQPFAFYGETFDGCCGTFVATITNFSAPISASNDAGVDEILNPSGDFCADSAEVSVRIKNFGINQITPVTLGWSINGTVQTPVTYSGVLDTAGGSGTDTATVSLGNYFFEDSISLKVWTTLPNNVADTSNDNDTLTFDLVAPNPEITLDNQDMCEGEFFILQADPGFSGYLWSTGSTAQQIQITQGGSYSVTVTDYVGCQDSSTALVTEFPSPVVDLGGDTSACDDLVLDAGNTGASFLWSSGETTQSIFVTSSGFYSVTVESAQGCETIEEVEVTINPSPSIDLGPNVTLCVEEGETAVLAAGSQFQFYNWNTGETTSNILIGGYGIPVGAQNFSVIVTDANGCTGGDTVKVNFVSCWPTGISDDNTSSLIVYPNPSQGIFSIELNTATPSISELYISDLQGRLIWSETNPIAGNLLQFDLSHLEPATYILSIRDVSNVDGQAILVIE